MNWCIFYSDRTTLDSTQAEPNDVIPYGVVVIAQPNEQTGRSLMHGWDFYYWNPEAQQWWGCDVWGLHDRLFSRLPTEAVCLGRTVDNKSYQELMAMAARWPGLPERTNSSNSETPKKQWPT